MKFTAEKHNGKKRLYILPVFVRLAIILLLAGLSFVCAEENVVSQPAVKDIPLPRQSAYTGKGFTMGLGMGVFDPSDKCDCLGLWQGQADYFYTPWFSGGAEIRFFGGEMDSESSILYSRYRLFGKFHLTISSFSLYLSPIVGLESTDLSELRQEWRNRSSKDEDLEMEGSQDTTEATTATVCEKMFSLDGFTAGLEFGMGYAFPKYLGIFGSVHYEHNFSRSQLLTLTPGLGFNMRSVWDWAQKNTYSLWFTVEGGFQRYFNRGVPDWSKSLIFGFTLGV